MRPLRDEKSSSLRVTFLGVSTLLFSEAVDPKRIIPIHWDDFSRPLDQLLVPLPCPLDDFDATMAFLRERAGPKNIDVKVLQAWDKIDPFADF
jgi:hypothetical protein